MSNVLELSARMDKAMNYATEWRARTDTADAFRDINGHGKDTFGIIGKQPVHQNMSAVGGYRTTRIAPELYGKMWNNEALGILVGFTPCRIRVVSPKTGQTLDAGTGRITVHLMSDDRTIDYVDMSTEILHGLLTPEQAKELED